jgi:uncharacterized protein
VSRDDGPAPEWGLGDAAIGYVAAFFLSILGFAVFYAVSGEDQLSEVPLWVSALLQVPLWVGLGGAPWVASKLKGTGSLARDFGLRLEALDVPVGLAIGMATQLLLVPIIYLPLLPLIGDRDISEEARQLTDRAQDPLGIVMLVLIVVIAAPVVEELFYRGLLMRSLERRTSRGWSLAISSVVFGLVHFQLLQLPALIAFGFVAGILAQRTGRLGPAITAHVAFNGVTVVALVWL